MKITIDEIRSRSYNVHGDLYEIPDQNIITMKTKINILCKKCNTYFLQTPENHTNQKQGCSYCNGNNKLSLKQIRIKNEKLYGNIFNIPEQIIVNCASKIKILCKECNNYFERNINTHINKKTPNKCPICYPKKLTLDKIRERSKNLHGNRYEIPNQEFTNNLSIINIYCSKCKKTFRQKIITHLDCRIRECTNCNTSKGENTIEKYLIDNKINFEKQKRFDNCRNILPLPFDFYLPDMNTCVEYDGELHYISKDYFGGSIKLEETQKRDEIKTKYCKDNDINLIRIKYNQNILEKMNEIL
jgi:very-short-patch-repair endonuclease